MGKKIKAKRSVFHADKTTFHYLAGLEGDVKITTKKGEIEVRGTDLVMFLLHQAKERIVDLITSFDIGQLL